MCIVSLSGWVTVTPLDNACLHYLTTARDGKLPYVALLSSGVHQTHCLCTARQQRSISSARQTSRTCDLLQLIGMALSVMKHRGERRTVDRLLTRLYSNLDGSSALGQRYGDKHHGCWRMEDTRKKYVMSADQWQCELLASSIPYRIDR
jgi:hypothetical protein